MFIQNTALSIILNFDCLNERNTSEKIDDHIHDFRI